MIVVTTPTGQIGRHVVNGLIAAGAPVRVIVRDAAKLHDAVRRAVEIVEGSHSDPEVIDAALDGVDSLFWLVPPDMSKTWQEAYLDFTRPAVASIRRHGVRRVVSLTSLGRHTRWQDTAGLVTASLRMDDLLMGTGAHFRGLAMLSFMDNMMRQVTPIREQRMISGPMDPDCRLPTTAVRDVGALAAKLLADNGWSGQEEIPVLGPEDLSYSNMSSVLSEILGREISYRQVPFAQLKQQYLGRGASESFAQGLVDMYSAKNEGMDSVAEAGPDGRMPTTFRQWAEDQLVPALRR